MGVRSRSLAMLVLALGVACGGSGATGGNQAPPPGEGGREALSLAFDVEGALRLTPRATSLVGIVAPTDVQEVALSLEGSYEDASLAEARVHLEGGRGSVLLYAPTVPATFALRARTLSSKGDAPVADGVVNVAVSSQGYAVLRVRPTYGGKRPAQTILASVVVRSDCATLAKGPVKDGNPIDAAPAGQPILLVDVPAEGHVSVVARVARYAVGCVDLDTLVAGSVRDVPVMVHDLPLSLATAHYGASLTLDPSTPDDAAWRAAYDAGVALALDTFMPAGASEGARLLDAMARAAPTADASAFAGARTQEQWDPKVAAWLGAHGPSLRARAQAYASAGRDDARGPLLVALRPTEGDPEGQVTTAAQALGGLTAAALELGPEGLFRWQADSEDSLRLAGALRFSPSSLACAAADGRGRLAVAGARGAADAVASGMDCGGLARELVPSGVAYGACGALCIQGLCEGGLSVLWRDAAQSSTTRGEATRLELTASARAGLTDLPEATSFEGTWVGDVTSPGARFGLKGVFSGRKVP